jgi:hypothetical protein
LTVLFARALERNISSESPHRTETRYSKVLSLSEEAERNSELEHQQNVEQRSMICDEDGRCTRRREVFHPLDTDLPAGKAAKTETNEEAGDGVRPFARRSEAKALAEGSQKYRDRQKDDDCD